MILDKCDYQSKAENILSDTETYEKLTKDPTTKYKNQLIKKLKEIKAKGELSDSTYQYLYPTSASSPKFYGLPKIHKDGVPLRPIVSSIGSVTYNLSKYLADLLAPLTGHTVHHIKDSKDFVNTIQELQVDESECMVSFDVTSLFTSIPVKEALTATQNALILRQSWRGKTMLSMDSISTLLELCLNTTYFMFRGLFYRQRHGCAMGSPVSPIVANIFMEGFEDVALDFIDFAPRIWRRYVDDTFCVIQKDHVNTFKDHLNSVNSHIQFTHEEESEGKLPFLDTLVRKDAEGFLHTSVYRKPTHTNQLLHFDSHHPLHQKIGVVKTLTRRAMNVSSDDDSLNTEKKVLKEAFQGCGYPDWAIRSGKALNIHQERQNQEDYKGYVSIPYVKGVSEPISRILSSVGVQAAMKPCNTLKQALVRPKDRDRDEDKAGVVYQISCKDCPAKYIGQTGRHLGERLKEHRKSTERGNHLESGVAEHVVLTAHTIDWSPKILDQDLNQRRRLVREAVCIKKQSPSMNREQGYELSGAYLAVLKKDGNKNRPSGGAQSQDCSLPQ